MVFAGPPGFGTGARAEILGRTTLGIWASGSARGAAPGLGNPVRHRSGGECVCQSASPKRRGMTRRGGDRRS